MPLLLSTPENRQPNVAFDGPQIFLPAYAPMSDVCLLKHFHGCNTVQFFTMPDADETRADKIAGLLKNRFEFNGEAHVLSEPVDWLRNPSGDVEWHILLHKFYYAVGLGMRFEATGDIRYAEKWVALTDSWIEQTPVDFIAADVTGRRIQNWIYAYRYFVTHARQVQIPADFHARFLKSLHEQVSFLVENLAPARNHRTLELYAIFLAAVVFPEWCNARTWREFALQELTANACKDILADGVHCELSTDYHHLVLRNFLCVRRLAQLNGIAVPGEFDDALVRALEFSMHVHKPDGLVPALSDGDIRDFRELLRQGYQLYGREDFLYAATEGQLGVAPSARSVLFPDSGYCVFRSGWGGGTRSFRDESYLVFDCGPLGEGNHGHFDLLSFELAAYGRSLVVDPGRYTYHEANDCNWRVKFRGTAYHNTVVIDGANQTSYLPGARKYKVRGAAPEAEVRAFESRRGFDFVHGIARSHEYPAVHERFIAMIGGEYWIVSDRLTSAGNHSYDLYFHLSPSAQGHTRITNTHGTCLISSPNLLIAQCEHQETTVTVEDGFVSPRYGVKHAAPVVRFNQNACSTMFHTVLVPFALTQPEITVRALPVWSDEGVLVGEEAQALRINFGHGEAALTDIWFINSGSARGARNFCNFRFEGSFLWLRKNAFGELIALQASANACLWETAHAVPIPGALLQ
jgi:Heparinase II/III N-terminus/Heparinase II/III-like protein